MVPLIVILVGGAFLYAASGDALMTVLGMAVVTVLLLSWISEGNADDVQQRHGRTSGETRTLN